MDTIKDFLSSLRERISNPLISSVIISWLFFNWQIVIGLIFYDQKELPLDGHNSYIDLINKHSNNLNMIAYPLLTAIVYTFGFPWVRAYIKLWIAKIASKNESEILKATDQGYMPMKKFIKIQDAYSEQLSRIKLLHEEESTHLIQISQLESELVKTKNDTIKLKSTISEKDSTINMLRDSDYNILNKEMAISTIEGFWNLTILIFETKGDISTITTKENHLIKIKNGFWEQKDIGQRYITHFNLNISTEKLSLILTDQEHNLEPVLLTLHPFRLDGSRNEGTLTSNGKESHVYFTKSNKA